MVVGERILQYESAFFSGGDGWVNVSFLSNKWRKSLTGMYSPLPLTAVRIVSQTSYRLGTLSIQLNLNSLDSAGRSFVPNAKEGL